MNIFRSIFRRLADLREATDAAFMAAAFAQAGEPELARETMRRADRDLRCCGAVPDGDICHRPTRERCSPALERGW